MHNSKKVRIDNEMLLMEQTECGKRMEEDNKQDHLRVCFTAF